MRHCVVMGFTLYHKIPSFSDHEKEAILEKKNVENGENGSFPTMFSILSKTKGHNFTNTRFVLCKCFQFGLLKPKLCRLVKRGRIDRIELWQKSFLSSCYPLFWQCLCGKAACAKDKEKQFKPTTFQQWLMIMEAEPRSPRCKSNTWNLSNWVFPLIPSSPGGGGGQNR